MVSSGPPYLLDVYCPSGTVLPSTYPFSLPLFSEDFSISFSQPITFIVGENGSGKSTLLESIAEHCGYSALGGNRNHVLAQESDVTPLRDTLRFSWQKKCTQGFFLRAETLFTLDSYFSDMAEDDGEEVVYGPYGGKPLSEQSHGESFMSVLRERFHVPGLYILDEPEAALSPARQMELLCLLARVHQQGQVQLIIATHSPLLMSFPWAEVLEIQEDRFVSLPYQETEHFKIYKKFMLEPEKMNRLLYGQVD